VVFLKRNSLRLLWKSEYYITHHPTEFPWNNNEWKACAKRYYEIAEPFDIANYWARRDNGEDMPLHYSERRPKAYRVIENTKISTKTLSNTIKEVLPQIHRFAKDCNKYQYSQQQFSDWLIGLPIPLEEHTPMNTEPTDPQDTISLSPESDDYDPSYDINYK